MPTSDPIERMAAAAAAFLDSLDAPKREAASLAFEDEEARKDWHYIPRVRGGLAFTDMGARQEKGAYNLVAAGVSLPAFAAVTTIIGLEDVLAETEGKPRGRHRGNYSTTVFGDPRSDDSWGWCFEGHHIAINVTVVAGEVASTPLFFGANPAEVRTYGGHVVTRPLAAEEDMALALVAALSAPQREEAMVSPTAPNDILTKAVPRLDDVPEPAGVRLAEMSGAAAEAAEALVRLYLERLPPALSRRRWERLRPEVGDIRFAFAGQPAHRAGHYYRLAGRSFFVEYDNTQNEANHVHTVLRDPGGDFGDDLLRAHLAEHHAGPLDP